MEYLTIDELNLCWENQLKKAHRMCMPRTLIVCEFPQDTSTLQAIISDTPGCFAKHGYGSTIAVLFSNELEYACVIAEMAAHYSRNGIETALSAVTYNGTQNVPSDDFETAARLSLESAFKNMQTARKTKQPVHCDLSELLQTQ
ncbi:hypothetical protein J4219_02505 [Candidatus Woesearchaeota archaeon]|nr:hypothetical protein [Candidatus Woesearchaeota archaeon]